MNTTIFVIYRLDITLENFGNRNNLTLTTIHAVQQSWRNSSFTYARGQSPHVPTRTCGRYDLSIFVYEFWLCVLGHYKCDRLISQWNFSSATTSTRHNSEQLFQVCFKEYRPRHKLRMMMTIIDFILPGYQASLAAATWWQTS